MFVELMTSRDGVHWLREEGERPPMLEGGPKRSWDHGMVTVASLVVVGDEMRIYYGGFDVTHGADGKGAGPNGNGRRVWGWSCVGSTQPLSMKRITS